MASSASMTAFARELPPPDLQAGAALRVFVQLVVNDSVTEGLVPLDTDDGRLAIAAADLRAAGIALPGDGAIDLARRSDIEVRYEPLEQRLYLNVPVALLPEANLRGAPREYVPAQASTGAAFNYNLYVQRTASVSTASLFTEQRLFGSFGTFSNNGVLRWTSGAEAARDGYLRYDTRYRFVDQDGAFAITAGDLITGALPWSTSVRMGGLQIGRNFAARPDLITTPLPRFAGEAAVPSAVDLFIDGYRQGGASVGPGRFVLNDMPIVNGAGQATVVTTDAVGRQVATTIPFYVSASLLRPGLTDFSAEVGALRRGYGLRSFGYGPVAASAVFRHGMTEHLTLAAHGEASADLILAGAGADWAPGLWGTVRATLTASRADGRTGTQATVGYDYSGRRFSIAAEHRRISREFRDLGSFSLERLGQASSSRVVASAQLSRLGSIGVGYIDARARGGARARVVSASWSLPVGGRMSAFASADYDLRRHAASGQVRLVVPLGRASASGGLSRAPGRGLRADAQFDLAVPTDGGWGLSAGAAIDQRGQAAGQATAVLRTRIAQWEASASVVNGQSLVAGGASGSVIFMDGGVFAANEAPAAFAVVNTGGIAGVPVTYENQPIGKTDRAGRLLIRDVTAYHPSRIAIDPLALDVGLTTSLVETRFAVAEGVGAVIRMPIRRTRGLTASLVDALGQPLAAGSLARLPDGTEVPVGWDGILYLADLPEEATIEVSKRDGGRCSVHLAPPASTTALAKLGAVPCT